MIEFGLKLKSLIYKDKNETNIHKAEIRIGLERAFRYILYTSDSSVPSGIFAKILGISNMFFGISIKHTIHETTASTVAIISLIFPQPLMKLPNDVF